MVNDVMFSSVIYCPWAGALRDLTSAVKTAVEILGDDHKFVEEAKKWQMRLHSQLKKYDILMSR